ncbi:hypothetical protein BU14_0442s0020 [Porphyra umbilicalis]|uniref:Superoxide dismutase copper/zinc binding domain-containing protein n=1 Tax=Porphyra umbilicalis TaxID=2786 RepID=A0A1X6NUZ4_PORUM|nr:hypothetical protein BU14_0442s0020 [Porphyra umbilicalis]|eukprot:OSX72385.1 hypothetical protein BU14_0442s0020 [Porphyra umbilicalis]
MAPLRRTAAAAVLLAAATAAAAAAVGAAAECPTAPRLVCTLTPTAGSTVGGSVSLTPTTAPDGTCTTALSATVNGLTPGTVHGWHVHEFGDVSAADGTATGGHFNPAGVPHALPPSAAGGGGGGGVRHAGDFGNLVPADTAGVATATAGATSALAVTSLVVGRGLIVHALRDDGGQPTGNAGARLAQCVLGVAPPVAAAVPVAGAAGAVVIADSGDNAVVVEDESDERTPPSTVTTFPGGSCRRRRPRS